MAEVRPPDDDWRRRLRVWRETAGLSRLELSRRAGVSAETIKGYEAGRRRPSRELLVVLLEALQVVARDRNGILAAAGFAPDGRMAGTDPPDPEYNLAEALADIERAPWPACITDETMAVVGANALAQRLWEVDLSRERLTPVERHFLCVMTETHFADRILNWDETAALLSALVKGSFGEGPLEDGQAAYLGAVMQHVAQGDTRYLQRFLHHWAVAEPQILKWRFEYHMTWDHEEAGVMRFRCLVNPVNRADRLTINDWIPADAESWRGVERLAGLERRGQR